MIVEASELSRSFRLGQGLFQPRKAVQAVSQVNLAIPEGSCLGIVGESGSGKSTLGRLLLGLLPPSEGRALYMGQDLAKVRGSAWRRLRRDLALVHQNPRGALDPRWTVGAQVTEPLAIHEPGSTRQSREAARRAAFEAVGLSESLSGRFPHQLSGGQRQRVVLARALTLQPRLIVMDEPTSALDVSVQAQVMDMIADLKRRFGLTYVFISHDLRNLRRIADRIAVMYAGRVVEEGPAGAVCNTPLHPYSQLLLSSVPTLERRPPAAAQRGEPPDPAALPGGCAFHPRCPMAEARCAREIPLARGRRDGRMAACHLVPTENLESREPAVP